MLDLCEIKEYIKTKKYVFITDVRFRPSDDTILIYISHNMVIEKVKTGFTSRRQIEYIKKNISNLFGKIVDVIFIKTEEQQNIEEEIYHELNQTFDEKVISLYLTFSGDNQIDAWVEVENLNDDFKTIIEKYLTIVLDERDFSLNVISWVNSLLELPTLPYLLRMIKTHQPIEMRGLLELLNEEYSSISYIWISRKLEQLMQKGLIQRDRNGSYVLLSAALSLIPAGTRYTSSDIERALALGKRKWSN